MIVLITIRLVQTEPAREFAVFFELLQVAMLWLIGMAAKTQCLKVVVKIFVLHPVLVMDVQVLPIPRPREISSAALAPPAAPLPSAF